MHLSTLEAWSLPVVCFASVTSWESLVGRITAVVGSLQTFGSSDGCGELDE